jgi:ABC-2 type transport system permease protein
MMQSFGGDLKLVALRALRVAAREPEVTIPAMLVPGFLFLMMVSALDKFAHSFGISDYKAFALPVAVLFAVTGVSRAASLVSDIKDGYFDRLLLTPVNRRSLLFGLMVADFVLVVGLAIPCIVVALALGMRFGTGPAGMLVFLLIAGLWGVAFNGFAYGIALRTGSPGAVSAAYLLFFPFVFLSTSLAPKAALAPWLSAIASVNPVTYLLSGMRSLTVEWNPMALLGAVLAVLGVGLVAHAVAMVALQRRAFRAT